MKVTHWVTTSDWSRKLFDRFMDMSGQDHTLWSEDQKEEYIKICQCISIYYDAEITDATKTTAD